MLFRSGTPAPVIARLNAALRQALATDAIKTRFDQLASVIPPADELSPEQVAKIVPVEIEKYKKLLAVK